MTLEAVVVGDLHFDGRLSRIIPKSSQYKADHLQKIVDWASKEGIRNVILAGDVCEYPRMSYESMKALLKVFTSNPKTRFYVILGNHDKYAELSSEGHSLEMFEALRKFGNTLSNVRIIGTPKNIKIDGHVVRFLPWPYTSFNKKCLNIAHTEVRGSKSDNGRVFKKKTLPAGKEVAIIGHLHEAHSVRNYHYVGTPYQTDFGAKPGKTFSHVIWDGPNDYEIRRIPSNPKYVLHNVVIQSRKDLKNIPKGETNLVKLIVSDGADVDPRDWLEFPNVVEYTPFKGKEELEVALNEELISGTDVSISTDDFFNEWVEGQDIPTSLKESVVLLRQQILGKLNQQARNSSI